MPPQRSDGTSQLSRTRRSRRLQATIEISSSDSFLDLCRNFALVVRRDDLIRRPGPNVFDDDRLAEVQPGGHRCRERQGLSIPRARKALDHSQMIAMLALPGGSACQNNGRFDEPRVVLPTAA